MAGKRVDALRALRIEAEIAGAKYRKEAEGLVQFVLRRRARVERDFYDIGVALVRLSDPRMYGSLGFKSFSECVEGRRLIGRSHAFRLIAVVRTLGRKEALRLGADKAYELTRYVEATPEDDLARALAVSDARIGSKRLSAISVRELRAATRAVKARGRSRARDPEERAARKAAREAQAALRKRAGRGVLASAVRGADGWRVRIEVPVGELAAIVRGKARG